MNEPLQPSKVLAVLADCEVEFTLIGALAVTVWSSELRGTADIDIMVPVGDEQNKARLDAALRKLRGRRLMLEEGGINTPDVEYPTLMFQTRFGKLDILYRPDGSAPYREIRARAASRMVGGHAVQVASRDDMIRMKTAGGRTKDLDDLALLTEAEKDEPREVLLVMRLAEGTDLEHAKDMCHARVEMFDEDAEVWVEEDKWLKVRASRAGMKPPEIKQWATFLAERLLGQELVAAAEVEVAISEP